jgi:hypothetical protein
MMSNRQSFTDRVIILLTTAAWPARDREIKMRLLTAVLVLALFAPVASRAETIVVSDDMGGDLGLYEVRLGVYRALGIKVRIDGTCASACTILTQLPADQICATGRARLLFHRIRHQGGSAPDPTRLERENARLVESYPAAIRAWIGSHGGLTDRLLAMPPHAVAHALGRCGPGGAAVAIRTP